MTTKDSIRAVIKFVYPTIRKFRLYKRDGVIWASIHLYPEDAEALWNAHPVGDFPVLNKIYGGDFQGYRFQRKEGRVSFYIGRKIKHEE